MLRFACIAALIAFAAGTSAQERHLHSYTLQRALPEQVVPALSAQLSPGSSVTPYRQQLILNVTDSEHRALLELLQQLDAAPQSLMISVRKQGQQSQHSERYGVDGHIGSDQVNLRTGNDRHPRSETQVVIDQSSARSSSDGSQQVRAVEGMDAYISSGTTLPVRTGRYDERALTAVESGFYANARIVGDEVIIDIDQRDDRVQRRDIATQHLQTQVRGRIGEWISLGSLGDQRGGSNRSYTDYRSGHSTDLSDIAIKVERVE